MSSFTQEDIHQTCGLRIDTEKARRDEYPLITGPFTAHWSHFNSPQPPLLCVLISSFPRPVHLHCFWQVVDATRVTRPQLFREGRLHLEVEGRCLLIRARVLKHRPSNLSSSLALIIVHTLHIIMMSVVEFQLLGR